LHFVDLQGVYDSKFHSHGAKLSNPICGKKLP
jgi:hypothetical protein